MDACNRFESRGTYLMMRLENLAALAACITLAVIHIGEIRWTHFIALFAYIDVIGYIPGAIAYRRSPDGSIPRIYFVLYNTMHGFLFNGAVVALWCLIVGPSWALLAIPIHLFGDRALFGNSFKPWGISFEPKKHPAFARFEREFGESHI
ncbi:MAG TPA: hypothetical protein VMH32_19030 [Burkholderiales bacterium]|nr:hypothetical protein [Burkholderiales bacterium]